MLLDCIGEVIVGIAREYGRFGCFQLFCARKGQRQDLHVGVSGIHSREPLVANVAKLLDEPDGATAVVFQRLVFEFPPGTIEKSCCRKVLFKGCGPRIVPLGDHRYFRVGSTFCAGPPRGLVHMGEARFHSQ